jgi:hypothetical protein
MDKDNEQNKKSKDNHSCWSIRSMRCYENY